MPRNDVQLTRFVGVMLDGIREDTPHPPKSPEHPYVTGNLDGGAWRRGLPHICRP